MNDLSLGSFNSSPESTISTDTYTQDYSSFSDPMLPDLYPNSKPLPIKIKKLTREPSPSAHQKQANPESYRRQLDEKLAKINFDDITVAELKETLRERGLSATGRKAELMNRLKQEHELVVQQGEPHVLLKRRLAMDQKKVMGSPKLSYHPYLTPPPRHASISIGQLSHSPSVSNNRLACSLPASTNHFLNDQFIKSSSPSSLRQESYDVWDDQMLENFLNQI
jgi:hypothetical protein